MRKRFPLSLPGVQGGEEPRRRKARALDGLLRRLLRDVCRLRRDVPFARRRREGLLEEDICFKHVGLLHDAV